MTKINKIAIFDMDGVLVDSSWRYRVLPCGDKIDLEFWRKHEHACYFDELLPMAQEYQKMLNDPSVYVIIATARTMNPPAWAFLQDKLGVPDYIIYREDANEEIGGAELKIRGLSKLFRLKQFAAVSDVTMFEDNIKYLKKICDHFNWKGVYIPSNQGH